MNCYYCFACKIYFRSESNLCLNCGRGSALARRELAKSTPAVDTYRIYVDDKLVGNQRVKKKAG
jgi:hypothetical protein